MKDIRPFSFPLIWGLFFCLVHGNAFAQGQGTVVDSQTRQILVGANVRIEGTNTGTTTDAQGAFSLAVETNQRIAISHTGYLTRIVSGEFLQKERVIAMTPIAVQLEDVVVTARRSAQHLEKVPQKIDVISRTDLDRTVADDLTDALKKQTAIDIIQYPGLLSGVGIRGFRPQFSGLNQRSLLLIDGRHAGASNLATIDLNNIERIEVMKGPGSALYGAQAMGGVVNIISRKSTYLPRIDLAASYGSFGTFGASLSAGAPPRHSRPRRAGRFPLLGRRVPRRHLHRHLGRRLAGAGRLAPLGPGRIERRRHPLRRDLPPRVLDQIHHLVPVHLPVDP